MVAEPFNPRDATDGRSEDEFRGGRRDWRRWWDKTEALDPEKWKAMASAWWCVLQDAAKEAQAKQGSDVATKPCPYCAEEIRQAAIKCKHCATWLGPVPDAARFEYISGRNGFDANLRKGYAPPRLTRSTADAMGAGVLSGLGHFFGMDPTWLRIGYALATVFTAIIPGIAVYAMLALIIPGDASEDGAGLG